MHVGAEDEGEEEGRGVVQTTEAKSRASVVVVVVVVRPAVTAAGPTTVAVGVAVALEGTVKSATDGAGAVVGGGGSAAAMVAAAWGSSSGNALGWNERGRRRRCDIAERGVGGHQAAGLIGCAKTVGAVVEERIKSNKRTQKKRQNEARRHTRLV